MLNAKTLFNAKTSGNIFLGHLGELVFHNFPRLLETVVECRYRELCLICVRGPRSKSETQ